MMQVFPVQAGPNERADFASLFGPGHQGTDIFAPHGTPVLAVADGRTRNTVETRGGNAVYLTEPDGTQYYYGHLDRFEGPDVSRLVKAGDVVGYVGTTGNAAGKAPHVHFEYRPLGGEKSDPFPELERVISSAWSVPASDKPRDFSSKKPVNFDTTPVSSHASSAGSGADLGVLFLLWAITKGSRK